MAAKLRSQRALSDQSDQAANRLAACIDKHPPVLAQPREGSDHLRVRHVRLLYTDHIMLANHLMKLRTPPLPGMLGAVHKRISIPRSEP